MNLELDKKWQWLAMDQDGRWWLFAEEPNTGSVSWTTVGHLENARVLDLPETVDWKKSLHKHNTDGSWTPYKPLEIDDRVLVRDCKDCSWQKRYFASLNKSGKVRTFEDGKTSWTALGSQTIVWNEWRLPEEGDR